MIVTSAALEGKSSQQDNDQSASPVSQIPLRAVMEEEKASGLQTGLLSMSLQWRLGDAQFGELLACRKVRIPASIIDGGCGVET